MTLVIPKLVVPAGTLLEHIGRTIYRNSPLYFGKTAENRFDDPKNLYGVLYLAYDLATAMMESVFHNHRWQRGRRRTITQTELENRIVRLVGCTQDLNLANLTAPNVMSSQFGVNLN